MLNIRRGDVLNDALSEAKKQKFYNDKHIKVFVHTLCINVFHALFKCVAWWNSLKPAKNFCVYAIWARMTTLGGVT